MMRREIVLLIMAISFSVPVTASSIGTVPGAVDLGQVERGETVEREIYVTTTFENNVMMNPELSSGRISSMFPEGGGHETSEEDIDEWVNLEQNVEINSNTTRTVDVGGSSANVEGSFGFSMEVPRDAEPGYHYGSIYLNANPSVDGEGAGSFNWGETVVDLQFRVPGNADRSVEVVDVEGLRSGDDSAVIRTDVRNTGTVTVRLRGEEASIYDSGQKTENLSLGSTTIAPGETETIETTWSTLEEDLQAGNYRLQGTMNYMTGNAFIDETFSITDFIQIEPSNNTSSGGMLPSGEDGGSPPTLLIVMFLVIVGSLMYTMDIDPLLIIMALGAIGISAFIWFSGLPAILAGLVLIVTLFLFYYGWM